MALAELLAALRRGNEEEIASRLAAARAEAAASRARARDAAARRLEAALAAERARLALEDASAAAAAAAGERARELEARARVADRLLAAAGSAAAAAERNLGEREIETLLTAGLRYLPAAEATLRCPPPLLASGRAAAARQGIRFEPAAEGEALALVAGDWKVGLGLSDLVESRWPEFAARALRELEGA